jgi:hypothetical protein
LGILAGLEAAIAGGWASAAGMAAAGGAGLYSAFTTYGETGSVTGALIAGTIAAVTTALSFSTGTANTWAESPTGMMVLQSEMPASGYLTAAQGRVIADVIRKGAGPVLQDAMGQLAGGGGAMALSKNGNPGGLGELSGLYGGLPGLMSGSVPLSGGLDYVPYDNFPARLHKGERVLTKDENRRGTGITINSPLIHIEGNLIADKRTFDDFVEQIDLKLQKRARLHRAPAMA